jgi:MFS family permease/rhodanese-related sulfurtransferase
VGNTVELGLKNNWQQFTLLVIINAFVGGMVGLERSILPQIAEVDFAIAAKTAILSFIIVFGFTKAITNYFTGLLANKIGRKNLLVIGWLFALPIPFILIYANSWHWVVLANVLLGINQGLTWSSTVVMKIDLVGDKNRGLAMGINESAGYLAVGVVAFLTGWIASEYGLRPYPFYLGFGFAGLGLLGSWFFVKDTVHHVAQETTTSVVRKLKHVFWETTWKDNNLGSISQAGLVNNLNDGMVWGLFPILLAIKGFALAQIAVIVAVYPVVWGLGQLFTGKMADHLNKKSMLFWGMLLQGLTLLLMIFARTYQHYIILSVFLGMGTAIVYPTFLAGMADYTHPQQRAASIGVFRLWRDSGYAFGAILTGIIADTLGVLSSVGVIAGLTIISAFIILIRMTNPQKNLSKTNDEQECMPQAEVESLMAGGRKIIIIDVRDDKEYAEQHIHMAINIPVEKLAQMVNSFDRETMIITACGKGGGRSAKAATQLQSLGFTSTKWLCGGTFGWA